MLKGCYKLLITDFINIFEDMFYTVSTD